MKKSYLFVFNALVGNQEQVKDILNRMKTIGTWRFDMPNVFYIISDFSAHEIAQEFEQLRGTAGRYIFTEYGGNAQGRLTGESWFLLKNKYHEPKKP